MSETQIQMRRDSSSNWATVNPILGRGEIGVESDTLQLKVGDGSLTWVDLPYFLGEIPAFIEKTAINNFMLL